MATRFSKDTVAMDIARRVRPLQIKHKFDSGNGTAQLRGTPMSDVGIDRCIAYGQIQALMSLANELGIADLVRDKVSILDGLR